MKIGPLFFIQVVSQNFQKKNFKICVGGEVWLEIGVKNA